jgi:sulfur carrier protein ThiS
MAENNQPDGEERVFCELRRKVQGSALLSAAVEKLLREVRFTGRLSVVIQNGRVLKSGYEEGYFRRKDDLRMIL